MEARAKLAVPSHPSTSLPLGSRLYLPLCSGRVAANVNTSLLGEDVSRLSEEGEGSERRRLMDGVRWHQR